MSEARPAGALSTSDRWARDRSAPSATQSGTDTGTGAAPAVLVRTHVQKSKISSSPVSTWYKAPATTRPSGSSG